MSAKLWQWTGWRVTSPYGWRIHPVHKDRRFHRGIDLSRPSPAHITAFVEGRVRVAREHEPGLGGYGIVVAIEDAKRHLHIYAHMAQAFVTVGQAIHAGQALGVMGSTGLSTGPHLHYEVRNRLTGNWGWGDAEQTTVDPEKYLAWWLSPAAQPVPPIQQRIRVVFQGRAIPGEAYLINGQTFIPARFVVERLGQRVDFDAPTWTVDIRGG